MTLQESASLLLTVVLLCSVATVAAFLVRLLISMRRLVKELESSAKQLNSLTQNVTKDYDSLRIAVTDPQQILNAFAKRIKLKQLLPGISKQLGRIAEEKLEPIAQKLIKQIIPPRRKRRKAIV